MAEVVRQSHSYYPPGADNPRQDPTYIDRVAGAVLQNVAETLLRHAGKPVHVESLVGGDPWTVHEAVECLRRVGWVIDGHRGDPGYTFVKWVRPAPWTRIETVGVDYTVAALLRHYGYPGPLELRPRRPAPTVAVDQTDIPLDTTLSESDPMPAWWRDPEPRPHVVPLVGQLELCP